MRKVKFFLFVITVCALFASCDKMTNNGNLDGMWQLISVSYNKTGGEDSIVNVKNERVYMNFQQKLGQITPEHSAPIPWEDICSCVSRKKVEC